MRPKRERERLGGGGGGVETDRVRSVSSHK